VGLYLKKRRKYITAYEVIRKRAEFRFVERQWFILTKFSVDWVILLAIQYE
jgi:hypothetical protein